jgi:hypothetical protein
MKRKHLKGNIDIGYYVVGFIDLLGQQDQLRTLRSLPDKANKEQMASFIQALKKTYGVVSGTRDMIGRFFRAFADHKPRTDLSSLTPEQRNAYLQLTNNPIQIASFSDSIIVFLSLSTIKNKLPTRGIFGVLAAAASTSLFSLAAGYPIRGGIDIGLGMEIEGGEIYGPSLARAYALESKIAQYPRIVVGKGWIEYLQLTNTLKPKGIYDEIGAATARGCLNLLTTDDDGCAIVDYLGKSCWSSIGAPVDKEIIEKAYNNVIRFSEEFQKANDTKKAFRYALLKSYFDHRLSQWGIEKHEVITQTRHAPERQ